MACGVRASNWDPEARGLWTLDRHCPTDASARNSPDPRCRRRWKRVARNTVSFDRNPVSLRAVPKIQNPRSGQTLTGGLTDIMTDTWQTQAATSGFRI